MLVMIAARADGFEVFCATEQGEGVGRTIREEIPLNLMRMLSDAGFTDSEVEQARRSVTVHGWAKCRYRPKRGAKNVFGVYPHLWNCLC